MKTVCIESPLYGDFVLNIAYARACLRYCIEQGVSPYASHLLIPQIYNDLDNKQREAGIRAGLTMGNQCDERWFFIDLGWSDGMMRASNQRGDQKRTIIELGDDWASKYPSSPTPGF
jgi:hypothetical protein